MDETNQTNQGNPPAGPGQTSGGKEGSTSPRTFTEGTPEYTQHISDILAKRGRDTKALDTEIKTLKGNNTSLASERDSLKVEIEGLREAAKAIEEAGGDAAKLQTKIRELTTAEKGIAARELALTERERIIQDADLSVNATSAAAMFQENDPERLIKLAKKSIRVEKGKAIYPTEDEIKEMATDILGWKPVEAEKKEGESGKKETNAPDSGLGSGAVEKPKENDGRDHIAKGLKNWK